METKLQSATYQVESSNGEYIINGSFVIGDDRTLAHVHLQALKPTEGGAADMSGRLTANALEVNTVIGAWEDSRAVYAALMDAYDKIRAGAEEMKTAGQE